MNVMTSYQTILQYVEFDALPKKEQEQFLLDLNSLIFRGAITRTLERMDERTRNDWYALIEKGASDTDMRRFIERRVPQAELALAETVETLAGDILAVQPNR